MTMLKTTKTETDFTSSVSVVNGIDTDAVHALIESVEAQPAQGMTHWRVASAWQGGARSLAQVDGFMIGGAVSRAISRSTSTNRSNLVAPMSTPTRRSTCWRRSTPA